METNGAAGIRGVHLTKKFRSGEDELVVFARPELRSARGERLALIGESGAGKSTLLYLLGGLDRPSERYDILRTPGHFQFLGYRARRISKPGDWFRMAESLVVAGVYGARKRDDAVADTGVRVTDAKPVSLARLDEVGLQNRASHRAGELSGGEQQRVALARALVGNPTVLLADEPTGNLDFRTGEMIISLLGDLHRSHELTSIYVTHNLSFATRCDRILQLDKGVLTPWPGDGVPHCPPDQEQPIMWKDGGNYV